MAVLGSPYLIQANLLTNCIYNCDYCYLKRERVGGNRYLRLSDYKKFVNKFGICYRDYGLKVRIDLTGGDLWLHPEFEQIIDETTILDYVSEIGLMINSLWHRKAKSTIKRIRKKLIGVQLNIDAYSKDVNDGDFEFLLEESIPVAVKILLSKNQNYFLSQMKIIERLSNKFPNLKVAVDRICPIKKDQIRQIVVGSEMKEMLEKVKSVKVQFVTEDPLLAAERKRIECEKDSLVGCPIPNGALTLYPDGKVKLCARIPGFETGFTINNFDLLDYVEKMGWVIKARARGCDGCSLFSNCRGGCPATSFVYNRDKIGRDINCVSVK